MIFTTEPSCDWHVSSCRGWWCTSGPAVHYTGCWSWGRLAPSGRDTPSVGSWRPPGLPCRWRGRPQRTAPRCWTWTWGSSLTDWSAVWRHLPGGEAPGTVHLDRGLEEDGPDQPVGPEEGELVLLVTASQPLSLLHRKEDDRKEGKLILKVEGNGDLKGDSLPSLKRSWNLLINLILHQTIIFGLVNVESRSYYLFRIR